MGLQKAKLSLSELRYVFAFLMEKFYRLCLPPLLTHWSSGTEEDHFCWCGPCCFLMVCFFFFLFFALFGVVGFWVGRELEGKPNLFKPLLSQLTGGQNSTNKTGKFSCVGLDKLGRMEENGIAATLLLSVVLLVANCGPSIPLDFLGIYS